MKALLCLLIRFYQRFLSPLFHYFGGPGSGCRFHPTCSHYALEAIERHGAARGSWISLKRLGRCHPWGGCGHDPVPPVLHAPISKNIKSLSSTPAWTATL